MHSNPSEQHKPIIGFSCGDLNGIGIELIIKALSDGRILDQCTPIVFASNKSINFYRKSLADINFNYQSIKDFTRINTKQVNILNCWEEEVAITPGQLNETGGKYAVKSLISAVDALKNGHLAGLVTAPIHKKNVQSESFNYTGHTPYLKAAAEANDVLMFMVAENIKVGLVTEHVPVSEISKHITQEVIISKLEIMHESLIKDFGIDKPQIAVLALNPHAGDEGLLGNEEETIIKPAIQAFKQNNNALVFGPYSSDAFFARGLYEKFDAVLAMYHDQGLIPFKSLAIGEGVNYTAGLHFVRTSPDHGTALDIAGKSKASAASFLASIFNCIDIAANRKAYADRNKNPLKKITATILANAVDEKIEE